MLVLPSRCVENANCFLVSCLQKNSFLYLVLVFSIVTLLGMVAAVIDTNQNGVIEFNEFCDWFVEEMLDRPEEEGFVSQYVRVTSTCGCLSG